MSEHSKEQLGIFNQQIKEMAAIYHAAATRSEGSDKELWVWYPLTEAGRAYGETVVMGIYRGEQRAIEKMSEQERRDCIALLGKYIRLLKEEI